MRAFHIRPDPDVVSKKRTENRYQRTDDLSRVDIGRHEDLRTCEGQELARKRRRPLSARDHLIEVVADRVIGADPTTGQLGVSMD